MSHEVTSLVRVGKIITIELVYTDKENFLLGHSEGSPLPRMGIFPPSVENCRVVSVMPELTLKTRELL